MTDHSWWKTTRGIMALMIAGSACYALIRSDDTAGLKELALVVLGFYFITKAANGAAR